MCPHLLDHRHSDASLQSIAYGLRDLSSQIVLPRCEFNMTKWPGKDLPPHRRHGTVQRPPRPTCQPPSSAEEEPNREIALKSQSGAKTPYVLEEEEELDVFQPESDANESEPQHRDVSNFEHPNDDAGEPQVEEDATSTSTSEPKVSKEVWRPSRPTRGKHEVQLGHLHEPAKEDKNFKSIESHEPQCEMPSSSSSSQSSSSTPFGRLKEQVVELLQ
jgi:hypothetical protein